MEQAPGLELTSKRRDRNQANSSRRSTRRDGCLRQLALARTNHRVPMNCNRQKNGCHVLFQSRKQPILPTKLEIGQLI